VVSIKKQVSSIKYRDIVGAFVFIVSGSKYQEASIKYQEARSKY